MNRKEITLFLSHTLERTKLNVFGKHYAKEVSIDPGTSKAKRVDYMQFSPGDQMSISGVEKVIFTGYEIKSCKDVGELKMEMCKRAIKANVCPKNCDMCAWNTKMRS